jgi:predicted RNase H-like nuclease
VSTWRDHVAVNNPQRSSDSRGQIPSSGSREIGRVLGVDACRSGWVAVRLDDTAVAVFHGARIEELVAAAERDGRLAVIAVDIPIGLPDAGRRAADGLARAEIGPLWSSVFLTPTRTALGHSSHAEASAANRDLCGDGISIQAFGLREKLLDVDRWIASSGRRAFEVHPEVVFAALAGRPLTTRKTSWSGVEQRRELLRDAGIHLSGDLGAAGDLARVDDVLDAAACAWTAGRIASGRARCMPDPPEVFSDGLPAAIWV